MTFQRLVILSFPFISTATEVSLPPLCYFPKDSGPCRGLMPAWHFNLETKQCEQFHYGGCMGNENRFTSQSDCDSKCTNFLPHQLQGSSSDDDSEDWSRTLELSECHELPFEMGRCRAALTRWSWNPDTLACEEFTYGGCEGNGNNFRTQRKCDRKCGDLAILSRNFQNDVLNIDEEEEEPEPEEVEETEEEKKERVCNLEKEMGPCRARFDRFYYDSSANKCKKFTFGGCEGNENNFVKKSDCESLCVSYMLNDDVASNEEEEEEEEEEETMAQDDVCSLTPAPGFCRGYFPRWAWDGEKCTEFVWGGCGGNDNKFDSETACEDRCGIQVRTMLLDAVPEGDDEEEEDEDDENDLRNLFASDDLVDPCSLAIQNGPCRALYPKWAFDGENCVSFMYGGCMGNANNFGSLAECRTACSSSNNNMQNDVVGDDEEEEEEEEEDANFAAVFPSCVGTGSGKWKSVSYSSKMVCTSLGNSHHSGDPDTQYLEIDAPTDSPSLERITEFVERFPNLKILVLNNLGTSGELNINLPENLVAFVSKKSGWTSVNDATFLRAMMLKELNLSGNSISRFSSNQFRSQKYLASVNLSGNQLGGIPQGLFSSSKRSFCDLILDDNEIQALPFKTFNGYRKLKKISLKGNPMEQGLSDNLFSQNPLLKCILLNGSGLESLSKNVFSKSKNPKLRQIDLTGTEMAKQLAKNWNTKNKVWTKLMKKLN